MPKTHVEDELTTTEVRTAPSNVSWKHCRPTGKSIMHDETNDVSMVLTITGSCSNGSTIAMVNFPGGKLDPSKNFSFDPKAEKVRSACRATTLVNVIICVSGFVGKIGSGINGRLRLDALADFGGLFV